MYFTKNKNKTKIVQLVTLNYTMVRDEIDSKMAVLTLIFTNKCNMIIHSLYYMCNSSALYIVIYSF